MMVSRYPASSDYVSLRDAMDRLVTDAFGGNWRTLWQSGDGLTTRLSLPMDVYATGDAIVLIASVPGLRPDDIEVTINKNTITLAGEIPNVAASEDARDATWYLHELPSGSFSRSVTLPVEVDAAQADATFENGVLKLVLPKAETAKPRKIEIRRPEAISSEAES
ncbi:MAG: Hsp20/alpha crystallin family protein [Thermomicrobiales bacterium]